MFITIALSSGTLAIGGAIVLANAAMTWCSGVHARKRQQVQHEYEEKAIREGHQAAMQQFQKLCDLKKEIAQDEFKGNMELLKRQQRQSLRDVGYFASLDEWPLRIPPMVMRNDNLFLNSNTEDLLPHEVENMFSNIVMQVEPVHIIMSPCRDKNFRDSFHAETEKRLSSFLEEYWGPSSLHPVVFYKQCWKDMTRDADEITVNNMFSKVSGIPTIIINPVIGKDSLRFETSFQNIFADNREGNKEGVVISAPILFPQDVYPFKRDMEYSGDDKERLSDEIASFLMSMLSMLVDQYYWRRYHIFPNQVGVILRKGISYTPSEIDSLADDYVSTLQGSMDNAEISFVADTDDVLNYCKKVDSMNKGHKCFLAVLQRLLRTKEKSIERMLVSLPFYGCDFERVLLTWCKQNKGLYNMSSQTIEKMEYNFVMHFLQEKVDQKLSAAFNHLPYNVEDAMSTDAYKKIKEYFMSRRNKLLSKFDNAANRVINDVRKFNDKTDKRDWARPRIRDEVSKLFFEELSMVIHENEKNIMDVKEACIVTFVDDVVKNHLSYLNVSDDIICQVSVDVIRSLKDEYLKPLEWKCEKHDRYNMKFGLLSNAIVTNRITYVFWGVDVVKDFSELSQQSLDQMWKSYDNNVWPLFKEEVEEALSLIFDGKVKRSRQSDEGHYSSYSPSEPVWGDPITETLGIY